MDNLTLFDGKRCRVCKKWVAYTDYYRNKRNSDGYSCDCKVCSRDYQLMYQPIYGPIYKQDHQEQLREKWRDRERDRSLVKTPEWRRIHYQATAKWQNRSAGKRKIRRIARNEENPEYQKHLRRIAKFKRRGAAGTYTNLEWQAVLDDYGRCCLKCGSKDDITADHVLPISKGGSNMIDNIQPLCRVCNSVKFDKHIDYRPLHLVLK